MNQYFRDEFLAGRHTDLSSEFCLCIPAAVEEVGAARRQIAAWTRAQKLPADDVDAVTLAFGEACSNAIFYGGGGVAAPVVEIVCRALSCGCLQIDVKNQGGGFSPDLDALNCLPPDDVFATHGRGFALMSTLMDDVCVVSDDVSTTVRLTKSRAMDAVKS